MTEQHRTPHERPGRLAVRPPARGAVAGAEAVQPRTRGEGSPAEHQAQSAAERVPDRPADRPAQASPPDRPAPGRPPGHPPEAPAQAPPEHPPAGHPPAEHAAEHPVPAPGTHGQRDRLLYLDAATRRIGRGLDLDETLQGLCRASVPAFADAILVYLRDPLPVGDERPTGAVVLRLRRTDRVPEGPDTRAGRSGRVPLLARGTAPSATDLVELRPQGTLAQVLREGRPVFAEPGRAQQDPASVPAAALAELLGPRGLSALPPGTRTILAPLRGRSRILGAVVLVRRPDRGAFEADDLLVAAQLATHTALGVDKAMLYGREAYIADALQRAMLPTSLPQPTGVRLAHRYLPAAETARVGGDWYDSIPLPGNRVALVVGDVMGHSMTSAAIMGQLRTTVQTLAMLDLPPEEVLYHLDEQAQRLGSDRMATCLYAVYDPVAHRLRIANAGHVPPLLLHRDGTAEVLRLPPGAPIGVGGVAFEAVELPAPADTTLVLYTDGLVESRRRDVWTGVEQLRDRLTAAGAAISPPPLEPLCDEILDIVGPGDRDDDVALLAARFDGIPPQDVAYWFLEPHPQTAGRARRLVRRALRRWHLEELSESTELLVSEVVTNAVRYAGRPITLRLLRTDTLRCEVGDDCPLLPRVHHALPSDEGGRGLFLVSRLARRWGATRLSTGKVVWFEQATPQEFPPPQDD